MNTSTVENGREEDCRFGLGMEETELRLALPGGKRSFSETIDLKLKLGDDRKKKDESEDKDQARKAQVVGWPPVRSFRKNILSEKTERSERNEGEKPINGRQLVKVSMDGVPYLRKIDLKNCKNYNELSEALEAMFCSFTSGKCSFNLRDLGNMGRFMDLANCSEYVSIYEDGDGDWMLVGDVPWEIFAASCRRLRVIHSSDAVSLAPSAKEKPLNRY